ncbi:MAG TPA: M20/M25/M40 family metallo-hydrolase [Pyrinomonadaceae bacterium]|nr:M20/M25/M40 family metallo-hydrolase [Pyrinomonadaceae bacterium]
MFKISNLKGRVLFASVLCLVIGASESSVAQRQRASGGVAATKTGQVLERNVRAHMEFLASDAMQGRGSGTQFELLAGHYIASQLRQYGIEPAGDNDITGTKTFIQTVQVPRRNFAAPPVLSFSTAGQEERRWTHGKEMLVGQMSAPRIEGALQKFRAGAKPAAGAVALVALDEADAANLLTLTGELMGQGARAVLVRETPQWRARWAARGAQLPQLPGTTGRGTNRNLVFLSKEAFQELEQAPDGTTIRIEGEAAPVQMSYTWNVVGVLRGTDPKQASEAVLLSAHMDHLGVGKGSEGDQIYNGADDDASGVVAVLELARALGAGVPPKRTVYFALFGSEEAGGRGSQHFIANSPAPLRSIVANLQFEMIGRPDPKVAADTLWLTGYDLSNLGAELARRGARLVADPHPEERFFQRSDNYALATQGVVAHTVSSYGLHREYHQPNDDLAHIDFAHMTRAINSMVAPVHWLVNSNFTPAWAEGKKP